MLMEMKALMTQKMSDVLEVLGFDQVVHADDLMAQTNEEIAEMRPQKPCAPCDKYPFHRMPPKAYSCVQIGLA